ncbi:MAG: ribonuclease T [Alphaproteobacteria bacterium]|nr:ribonuclease T [Alphaproteobacteria bacterium]MBU0793424.1 ribonuclease T [Alphaproteobacteria bacterium]MBU0876985.1 ribonuclease T [Alphaproteobacteria bacterium]MBU1768411.1 ribonuclease T [Alphaproteobacteria bacterium]
MRLALAALALLAAAPAQAQLTTCTLPESLTVPRTSAPSDRQPRRIVPIGNYTLALSWSPEHCAGRQRQDSFQCEGRGNRFGFILHGLWPNGRGALWPQYCRPAQTLSPAILRQNLCATPSVDLLQHEWAKHGTCMSRTPGAYFDRARALYGAVRFPDMAALAAREDLTRSAFIRAFLAANRRGTTELTEQGLRVQLSREGWLEEVRLCLGRDLRFAACARNAGPAGAPGEKMRIRMRP